MGFLKNVFKKKPGGTFVGNLFRGAVGVASSLLPASAANAVSSLIPAAPPLVTQAAEQAIVDAAVMPVATLPEAKNYASMVKVNLLNLGASADEASKIGAAAFTASQLAPAQAQTVLDTATAEVNVKAAALPEGTAAFGSKEIKTIFNGAMDGAMDGATDAYLNKTDLGQAQKKGAINSEGAKIMPWVIGVLVGVIGLLMFRKN